MSEGKRYFWLKLYEDFFSSKRIKKLRSIAGGDTYTIIYLKMQLKALKTEGYLYFDGVMEDFAEELALDIDESPDDVRMTIQYLMNVGLLESNVDDIYRLTFMNNVIGSETASAQRSRVYRAKKKDQDLLQCNTDATQVQQGRDKVQQITNVEIDIEKDKDIDISIGDLENAPSDDDIFEQLWKLYPRKKGKGGVSKTQKHKIAKIGLEEMTRAVERFKEAMKGKEEQYIMYGSSFFNTGYVDYLDSNYEEANTESKGFERWANE